MKRMVLFLFLVLGYSCSNDSFKAEGNNEVPDDFQNVVWTTNFGGAGDDSARSLIQTNDGDMPFWG